MKGATELLMLVSGFVLAPFLVTFVAEFFGGGYPWLPFFIVLLVGGVVYAVGVLRFAAIGILLGVILFGVMLTWFPAPLESLPENVKTLEAPL